MRRLKQAERSGNMDEALRLTAELTAIAASAVQEDVTWTARPSSEHGSRCGTLSELRSLLLGSYGVCLASDDKFGRLRQLVDSGKEKGYVLYDEVNDLLPDDIATGPELDDLLADFDSAGVEILEEPKLEFDKKLEDGEEFAELDLAQDFGDKTNDPVRMYLREMGTVPLLTREGEIELAKRIERGQRSVNKSLSRSPLIIREVAALGRGDSERQVAGVRTSSITADPRLRARRKADRSGNDAASCGHRRDRETLQEGRAMPARSSLGRPRQTKPRQHRSLRFELGRILVSLSHKIRGSVVLVLRRDGN